MSETLFLVLLALTHMFRHYLAPQGLYYLLYKKIDSKISSLKIQKKYPNEEQLKREKGWIQSSQYVDFVVIMVCFALYKLGALQLLFAEESLGFLTSLKVFLIYTVAQDFYFYVTHRLLHIPYMYKNIHLVHHRSTVTTPLTSFCVHPIEKFIELLFYPIMLIALPINGSTLLLFIFLSTVVNIAGHAGFEFKWLFFRKPDPIGATSVFHEMHHMYPNNNFSLYFIIWDKLFKTEHRNYKELYQSRMNTL